MNPNRNRTSKPVSSIAGTVLANERISATARSLAGSALAQSGTAKQTGVTMERVAACALDNAGSSAITKRLAGSVLSQSNKQRR